MEDTRTAPDVAAKAGAVTTGPVAHGVNGRAPESDRASANGANPTRDSGPSAMDDRFELVHASYPVSAQAAQTQLVGVMLGRPADSSSAVEAAKRDWADPGGRGEYSLIDIIGRFGITKDSFSHPGYWLAYEAAIDERNANGGAPCNLAMVHARLIASAEAEGAHHAYGIEVYQHLEKWATDAPPAVNAAYVAWTVKRYESDRALDRSLETARGERLAGRNSKLVRADLIAALQAFGNPVVGVAETNGLTRAEEEAFWSSTPQLRMMRQAAYSRGASSWATLMCGILDILTMVPPEYKLPDIIGAPASLNAFGAIEGESGDGKNIAQSAARRFLDVGYVDQANIGTGEGIAASYVQWDADAKEFRQIRVSRMFLCGEVDMLGALTGRKGATLAPVLRNTWMGEQLGNANATPDRNRNVDPHTYRATMIVNVQPKKAAPLLNEKEVHGGTPQRFFWTPAYDPFRPKARNRPPRPGRMTWTLPRWDGESVPAELYRAEWRPRGPGDPGFTSGEYIIGVCDAAAGAVLDADDARNDRRAGRTVAGSNLDGHALLNREKWGFGLALFHGVLGLPDFFWDLSEVMMVVSDCVRDRLVAAEGKGRGEENARRALDRAEQEIAVGDARESESVKRSRNAILSRLQKVYDRSPAAWATGHSLRETMSRAQKDYFGPAMVSLAAEGLVVEEPTDSQGTEGMKYRLV